MEPGARVGPTRVWVDDRNAIFRRGLAACVAAEPGFTAVGESAGLLPEPPLERIDILVFDMDDAALRAAVRLTDGSPVRLVGLAPAGQEDALFDAVEAGLAGFLVRTELSPAGLTGCLRSVAAGNGSLPSALLAKMVDALARGGVRGASAGRLARREVDVLRLLADGGDTREIAGALRYSERTVKNIVHDVLVKMNCRTRAHAVATATRQGFI